MVEKMIKIIGLLLSTAILFFLNIYIVNSRLLHILIIIAFFFLPYFGHKLTEKNDKWIRISLLLLWFVEFIVFAVYTIMVLMFSYPP